MTRSICILFFLIVVLSSCVNKEILDDVRIATAVGFELAENEELKVTAVVPNYMPDKTITNEVATETARINKEAREKLDRTKSRPYVSGKIEVLVYSKEISEKGLMPYIDSYFRDPTVGSKIFLTVTDSDIQGLLQYQYGTRDNGMYISDMIEHNINVGSLPTTNFHDFLNSYYAEGKDPFLPLIRQIDNEIKIIGNALFKDDKLVGEIPEDKLFTFKSLMDRKTSQDSITIEMDKEKYAFLHKIKSNRTFKFDNVEKTKEFTININIEGLIHEYSGGKIDKKMAEEITKKTKEQITSQAEEMIKTFQELETDPLGLGEHVRSHTKNWDSKKWYETYPNLNVTVNTKVKLTETGIIE
ncbi:Ger(x)C family spore germination protein [Ornithinibacillus caprae]|uniref:Ger(x)C family spore germination protein n=1 Tax=Ornithinibacillus caprae TaxID=2678566 RepID=UPI0018C620A5|nr:Ger(x)C family spore germination protein [Ornithinibacillus caprae]